MQPPQGGQTGPFGGLDLGMVIQAVKRNNPGASPRVIAGAVQGFLPMMNAQAQMEWRQFQAEQRMQGQMLQYLLGMGKLEQGQERIEQRGMLGRQQIDIQRQRLGLDPLTDQQWQQMQQQPGAAPAAAPAGAAPAPTGSAHAIYEAVKDGRHNPNLAGLGPMRGTVEGLIAKDKDINLADLQLEWRQAERMVAAATSPQVVKWQSTALSVQNTISDVRKLSQGLNMNSIRIINKANLERKIQVDQSTPDGKTAQSYINKVLALRGELATLEQGGYAPTQDAWEVAKGQIDTSMAVGSMDAALSSIDDIVGYRLKAMHTINPRFGQGSRYMGGSGAAPGPTETPPDTPPAPAPGPGTTPGSIDLGGGGRAVPRQPAAPGIAD
jgi:hypothetical protein